MAPQLTQDFIDWFIGCATHGRAKSKRVGKGKAMITTEKTMFARLEVIDFHFLTGLSVVTSFYPEHLTLFVFLLFLFSRSSSFPSGFSLFLFFISTVVMICRTDSVMSFFSISFSNKDNSVQLGVTCLLPIELGLHANKVSWTIKKRKLFRIKKENFFFFCGSVGDLHAKTLVFKAKGNEKPKPHFPLASLVQLDFFFSLCVCVCVYTTCCIRLQNGDLPLIQVSALRLSSHLPLISRLFLSPLTFTFNDSGVDVLLWKPKYVLEGYSIKGTPYVVIIITTIFFFLN